MKPTRCPGPIQLSRREVLQVGAAGLLGLSLPNLLRADERRHDTASADACIVIFLNGGPQPSRYVGHEARRSRRDPRRVQAHRHVPCRRAAQRTPAAPGRAHAPLHPGPLAAPQRQQRPRRRGLYRADRPRSRRDRRRPPGRPTIPSIGSVVGMAPAAGNAGRSLCVDALRHPGGRGGPPQPGFFGGCSAGAAIRCSSCATPNAPPSPCPSWRSTPTSRRQRLDDRQQLLERVGRAAGASSTAACRDGRLPGPGVRPAHLAGHPPGLPDRPRAGPPSAMPTAATSTGRACCWRGG